MIEQFFLMYCKFICQKESLLTLLTWFVSEIGEGGGAAKSENTIFLTFLYYQGRKN